MTDEPRKDPVEISRRQYLSSVGALGAFSFDSTENSLIDTPDKSFTNVQSSRPAASPYPENPFMPGQFATQFLSPTDRMGWKEASVREEYETLLGLHLDLFDSARLATFSDGELMTDRGTSRALSLSFRTGLPTTAGRNTTIATSQTDNVQPIVKDQDWTFPSGENLDSVAGAYAETVHGDDQFIEYTFTTNGIPSVFAPLGLYLMKITATKRFEQGFSGFFIDKLFNFDGLDFSEWATAAFQNHIQSLPQSRQKKLDIENPSTFDIKEYLRLNDLMPGNERDPRSDPIFREYVIHNHLGIQNYLASFRQSLIEKFPKRFEQGSVAIWANQFTGSLSNPHPENVYGSPYWDVINTELFPTVNPAVGHKYKLLEAIGNFEKPVIAKATLTDNLVDEPEFDPTDDYPYLERFQLAESHANGAKLKIPLSPRSASTADESITQWIRDDGTVPATLQRFADFVWTHKRFLTDTTPETSVAVVWPLPDRLYEQLPQWNIGSGSQSGVDTFIGATTLLREAQIPYTVLVFGHSDLWEDAKQLDMLTNYDAVVLPATTCLSDSQFATLETFLNQDGYLISSGPQPDRTDRYVPRTDVHQLFGRQNAVVLQNNPGLQRHREGTASGRFLDALAEAGITSVSTGNDSTLSVNIRKQSEPPRTIIHLLNYDYSKQSDSFDPKRDITIEVPSPIHSIGVARYYSEQETVDIGTDGSGDTVNFTVPKLTDWGFVVLAPTEQDLASTEDPTVAREAVDSLHNDVETASQSQEDWSPAFTIAETRLEEANKALDKDAYTAALATARKGAIAAQKIGGQRPVVGIDLSHGQAASFIRDNPFERLQANIAYPDYRTLESWTNDPLDAVDILIIPPALTFRGESHDFGQKEIDSIKQFVDKGGNLVVLARGGIAPDIAPMLSQFGYSLDGGAIRFPTGSRAGAPTITDHELTQAVPEISADLATTIVDMPSEATPLAAIPKNNEAWFHEEPPLDERSDSEVDVPSDPIYAVSEHGLGTVVVLGNWAYLHSPEGLHHWTPVMHNLFSMLSTIVANPLQAIAGDDNRVDFNDVLQAISAFNSGSTIGGHEIGFKDVLEAIRAFNTGEVIN